MIISLCIKRGVRSQLNCSRLYILVLYLFSENEKETLCPRIFLMSDRAAESRAHTTESLHALNV